MTKPPNQLLKERREDLDITQEYIAKKLKTNQAMIWRYESGRTKIPIEVLKIMCQEYRISSDYILGLPRGLKYPK